MKIKQRDIVLVPVKFSDQSGTKRRPVIIISNEDVNDRYLDVIYCMITSRKRNLPHEVPIIDNDLESGALKLDSYIRVCRISCIEKEMIIRKVGRLKEDKFKEVHDYINDLIDEESTIIVRQARLPLM